MDDDEYGMDYNEDYFGAEQQENADFAQDTDEYNMYPTEDGFWTNSEPYLTNEDYLVGEDPTNDFEIESFFKGY